MSPAKIQYHLKVNKLTQKDLAKQLGVCEMTVSTVINRRCVSDRVMRAVAEAIGQDVRKVFPEYYLQSPKRRHSKAGAI
jgi:lambda repressor-like predicted transcriptional regulator